MNARWSSGVRLLARLFALALRLYPDGVRREYAAEMQAVFNLKAEEAARRGSWALCCLVCREAYDLPAAILSAHARADRGRMRAFFPATSDQTPWPAALLSLLPFFVAGPLRIIVSYQPGWMPAQRSLYYFVFLYASFLSLIIGLALGVLKKSPRWVYPYPIYLAFSLYLLLGYAVSLFHGNALGVYFIFFLAVILFILGLPGFRTFYSHIPRDWTLLSYGLFGLYLYLLSTIDFDAQPGLNLMILLPSLLGLGSALAHLRIRSVIGRIAALQVGTFIGLFIWLIPIFQGMVSAWIGIGIGLFMLLLYGGFLGVVLLAPMLVTRLIPSR